MVRIYLPTGPYGGPFPFSRDEYQELMQRLWQARYLVPGAKALEIQQLRDLVVFAEYRAAEDEERAIRQGQEAVSRMDPKQVSGALKEFFDWRRKRQQAQGLRP